MYHIPTINTVTSKHINQMVNQASKSGKNVYCNIKDITNNFRVFYAIKGKAITSHCDLPIAIITNVYQA